MWQTGCLSVEIKMWNFDMTQRWNARTDVEWEMAVEMTVWERRSQEDLGKKPLRWFLQFAGWVSLGKKKGIWVKNWSWENITVMCKVIKIRRDQQKMLRLPGCSFTLYNCRASKVMVPFLCTATCATSHTSPSFPFSYSYHVITVRTGYFLIWHKTHSLKEKE